MREICMLYVHGSAIGYGRLGVELVESLTGLGVDIYDQIQENVVALRGTPQFMLEQDGTRRHKKTNVVCWVSTPGHARGWWDGQHAGIFTMFETDTLPEGFREALHNFDTVIVPSDQNVELFSRYHPNVHKVPLGIDTEAWRYMERTPPTTEFRFLIGGSGARKGTDLAVKAFRKVFPDGSWGDGPVPVLILKSPKPEDFYGERIRRVGGRITALEELELYGSAHCYLQPSRGEGFGLQPLQAIAQGCPTILTDAHGHKDFSFLGYGLPTTMSKAAYFIYGDAGYWWEPDFDALCDYMRWVYDNYAEACEFAIHASGYAHKHFTWDATANQFLDVFGDEMDKPYSGSTTWVEPEMTLYRTRLVKEWKADIAGTTYIFQPGVDYYEPADVKRMMFEADVLDLNCMDGDVGLTESQALRAEVKKAEQSFCPTCGQKLGTGVSRADEILNEMDRQDFGRPSVTVASMFRNSEPYLERYFAQIEGLREYMDVRLVLAEGDSTDDTVYRLQQRGIETITVNHGGDRYGSVDHPARWENIAKVMRPLLEAVGDPGDAFIYVESDLQWDPAHLAKLVLDLEEVRAVAPMVYAAHTPRFYDVWGYRKNGTRFSPDPPYHSGLQDGALVPIDSCGSCFVLRPDTFKGVVAAWDGVWPFHCDQLHLDTETEVRHP